MSQLLPVFIFITNQIRLYHWHTRNYARHIASGDLYDSLDKLIDNFVETLQGKMEDDDYRIEYQSIKVKYNKLDDEEIIEVLKNFKDFLVNEVESYLNDMEMKNTDLKNIRDEMLNNVNRTLYLFSLE